ncbi:MAG TPA: NifU family protein [bacterium]
MTLRERVDEVLQKIRPMLQMEGGDVELVDVDDSGVVKVQLKGACAGCDAAYMTLQIGIEERLREEIPEIKRVEAVMGV